MRFQSLTRQGIMYEYDKTYNYDARGGNFADNYYEFLTYGDGNTQHSPRYLVATEYGIDVMASFASYLIENRDQWNDLDMYSFGNKTNREEVAFFLKLKYNPDKRTYYDPSSRRKSTSESKAYDKRWFEVPTWADGSPDAIYRLLCKSYQTYLDRFRLYDAIRDQVADITGCYYTIDTEEHFGIDIEHWRELRDAVSIIARIHGVVRDEDGVKSSFGCLKHNWIDRQVTENVEESV